MTAPLAPIGHGGLAIAHHYDEAPGVVVGASADT